MIHLKKQAWTKAKASNKDDDWKNYKIINNDCKKLINNKYKLYLETAFNDMANQPKKFWNLVSIKNGKNHLYLWKCNI